MYRSTKAILFFILSILAFIIFCNVRIIAGNWNRVIQPSYEGYTQGLVLGASVYKDGRLSPALRQRVDASLDAYNTGMIGKIVLSGYDKDDSYLEAMSMGEYVLSKSVKEEDIFLDRDGYDTLASMQGVFDFIDDPKIIIFTQRYHLRRSIFLARQSGLDAVGYSSQDTFSMTDFGTFREIFARVKAFIEVYFGVLM